MCLGRPLRGMLGSWGVFPAAGTLCLVPVLHVCGTRDPAGTAGAQRGHLADPSVEPSFRTGTAVVPGAGPHLWGGGS